MTVDRIPLKYLVNIPGKIFLFSYIINVMYPRVKNASVAEMTIEKRYVPRYITLEIYTLFLTAIILNFSSFHDSSLTAWAGHWLLGRLKQL